MKSNKKLQKNKKTKHKNCRRKTKTNLVGNENGLNKHTDKTQGHISLLKELCNGAVRDMVPKSPLLATLSILFILIIYFCVMLLDKLKVEQVLNIFSIIFKYFKNM